MKRLTIFFLTLFVSVNTIHATWINNIEYFLSGEGTAIVASYNSNKDYGNLVIPERVKYDGKTFTVIGIDDYAFDECSSLTSVTIPNTVKSIGRNAFKDCSKLTSVTIGNSVTSIGDYAFQGCSSLTSVTIGESVTSIGTRAFYSCSSLTSVTIPNSVTKIWGEAFIECTSLTKVYIDSHVILNNHGEVDNTNYFYSSAWSMSQIFGSQVAEYIIGEGVKRIGDYAFYGCSKLTSFTIPESVTRIGEYAFYGCKFTSITIPKRVTSINNTAFLYCLNLRRITINSNAIASGEYKKSSIFGSQVVEYIIGDDVKSIGDYAFSGCTSLTSVTIPNSVTSIGNEAFYKCSKLTSVTIPNSVTSIGNSAFEDCSSLTSVTIGKGVTSIGENAFLHCYSLTKTNYTGDVASWCNIKFGNYGANPMCESHNFYINDQEVKDLVIPNSVTSIGHHAFDGCSSLTSVTIPNSVTSIGEGAFGACSSLTSVTIPNSVTSIGDHAFSACSSLTSVTIPNSVTSIGNSAFYVCSSLTSVTIPNSVTSIGDMAFYECSSLTSITCEAETPPTLSSIAFAGVSISIPVYVPCGCVEAYKAKSSWKDFTNIQEPLAEYSIEVDVNDSIMGTAKVDINSACGTQISAIPNIGYHFVQWNDGNTDTIRTLVLTQDTTFTAEFAPNTYTISTQSSDAERGTTSGDVTTIYLDYVTISATANYGYHFAHWNDGNTDNPRTVKVTGDGTYTAYFDKNTYYITKNYDSNQGYVDGYSSGEYLDNITLTAKPNFGYHFVQWSDGVSENPRTFVLTQDTTFTAQFALNTYTISSQSSDTERGTTSGDITTTYLDYVTISATANYGYHFEHWDDYNYDNPRKVQVTEDKTYTAYFDKNTYYITKNYDSNQGYVDGYSSGEYLDNITLTAKPNYGYHFVQWNDGATDNPRTFVLTQDTTFTAEFAPNTYTISSQSSDTERGTTSGDITTTYLDYVTITATANYGYHFAHWDDYNYDNPRQVQVTENKTYTVYFDKNTYYITKNYDSNQGYVDGYSSGEYLDNITLTAEPNYGYHFVQWSDGNTDNPRHFILTQDTTFSAEFAQTFFGQCGDNLYWNYDKTNQTISITGSGDMYDYTAETQPWLLFKEEIIKVTTTNTVTSIGTSAFEGCVRLGKVSLGIGVENIAASAFAECNRLYDVYCFATYPPFAAESSFANYNVYLYVPCKSQRDYTLDVIWGKFKFIVCVDSEEVTTDDVVVTPGTNDVTITWPTEGNADTYTIVIKKGNEVFCTLTFNAEGQLLNIAFAPGRDGNHPAQYAEQAGKGYRFTVTNLESGTKYGYNIEVKDASNKTIKSHSGEFTTQSTTAVDNITTNNANIQKIIRDGQFIIVRDGVEYNAVGQKM